jgi:hypothetical protein
MRERFLREHEAVLAADQAEIERWVRERATALCGGVEVQTPSLFTTAPALPPWKTLPNPGERLAAFATDAVVPTTSRREAETALRLYRDRQTDLDRRRPLPGEDITPLGLLLLVPGGPR